jgi:MFS superfamily sulfate permease-like transporter
MIVFPDFSRIFTAEIWIVGVTIAVVASLETLLCVEATDKMDPWKRITPTNRELRAQGIGNMLSGFVGGLPITQVIVRSSANIQSGGKTKMSAFLHGILLLVCVLAIPQVLNMIPLASLAAILFVVGYKLAKPSVFKQIYRQGWTQFIPFVVTIVAIVFTDLLIGIGIGLSVAIFNILYYNYLIPYSFKVVKEEDQDVIHIELSEDVSFLNKASIMKSLKRIPDHSKVVIDARRTKNIDLDVVEIINDFKLNAEHNNIQLKVLGLSANNKVSLPVKAFNKTADGERDKNKVDQVEA